MFEKHLWKSDILRKDAGHRPQLFFKHFASKNKLPGFYLNGTLVEKGLNCEVFPSINSALFMKQHFLYSYLRSFSRSSYRKAFWQKGILKNAQINKEAPALEVLFFNKVAIHFGVNVSVGATIFCIDIANLLEMKHCAKNKVFHLGFLQ